VVILKEVKDLLETERTKTKRLEEDLAKMEKAYSIKVKQIEN
jgi:hypothetical protein